MVGGVIQTLVARYPAPSKILPTAQKKLDLKIGNQKETFDQVLATVAPKILANLTPDIGKEYREKIDRLIGIGAVMLIFSLKHPLSKEKYYWYNLPKSAGFPFLAYVEHTNFVSKKHFNDEHLAYCGDYLEPTHEYFSLTKNQPNTQNSQQEHTLSLYN